MESTSTLNIIEGDYGLVSLDISCIQTVLYAKVKKIPVEIQLQNSVKHCALYNAPCLRHGKDVIQKFPNIVDHWKNVYSDLNEDFSAKQSSETLALVNLVMMKLNPVLQYLYWVDQRNCEEFTSRWFMRALPLPFNYAYVKRKKNEAAQLIESLFPLDSDLEVVKEFISKMATQCLSTLSVRLNKSNFFYGDQASMLDIVVYSHIAPLIKLPFVSNDLCALVSMWPNLIELVKRIDAKYLPDVTREVKYLKTQTNIKQDDDEVSYVAVAILVVSATSLVIGFAIKRGFVQIPSLF